MRKRFVHAVTLLAFAWLPLMGGCKRGQDAEPVSGADADRAGKDGLMEMEPRRFSAEPLQSLGGGKVNPVDDGAGKVVLINLWATWCPPCVEEMPSMERLTSRMSGRNFRAYAVSEGEGRSAVEQYQRNRNSPMIVLLDPDQRMFEHLPSEGLPTTVILDRSGRMRYLATGAIVWDRPSVVAKIEGLLGE